MLKLTEESKEKLLKQNDGEGVIFVKLPTDRIFTLNFHVEKDGHLYSGGQEVIFDPHKVFNLRR